MKKIIQILSEIKLKNLLNTYKEKTTKCFWDYLYPVSLKTDFLVHRSFQMYRIIK